MKKKFILLVLLGLCFVANAQYRVKFLLKEKTTIQHDSIYITGTFSNWDSTLNSRYLLKKGSGMYRSIIINLPKGEIKYKFHRGNWLTVEKGRNGEEVPDRSIVITRDTTLVDSVEVWRDQLVLDKVESLKYQTSDTSRIKILAFIANDYAFKADYYNSDSAFFYAQQALALQQKAMASGNYNISDNSKLAWLQEILATLFHSLGNFPKSLQLRLENIQLTEKGKDKQFVGIAYKNVASEYFIMKDYRKALYYSKHGDSVLCTISPDKRDEFNYFWNKYYLTQTFYCLNESDSALYYLNQFPNSFPVSWANYFPVYIDALRGDIYSRKENKDSAFYYYRKSLALARRINDNTSVSAIGLAKLFQNQSKIDSALFYARIAFNYFRSNSVNIQTWGESSLFYLAELSPLMAELYRANKQLDSAYKYLNLSVVLKDSIYTADKVQQFQSLTFNESSRKQQLEQQAIEAKKEYDIKVKMIGLIMTMLAIVIVASVLYRNNKQKQKANTLLQLRKEEIESTLGELKNTQKQLIQSEKMASLGELTAGIAHEIQNPLNFVNNFSEVSNELLDEMTDELNRGDIDEAKAIANDIKQNLEKINHHGKRADAIVKGMLQHSRSSTSKKELTDINKLADEYLRLAYHGLRAKDKSFNATLKTDFDESIGNINIIPQDIGRVILNLITNAFYVVDEKKKQQHEGYEPEVFLTTKKIKDKIELTVCDNGSGIPQQILDKIFQPFFTTKPTGQGTGLGLSLSYDIIKANGGELKVRTTEGKGTEFIIALPIV